MKEIWLVQWLSFVAIYSDRSISVNVSKTVIMNSNLFTISTNFFWLSVATMYFFTTTRPSNYLVGLIWHSKYTLDKGTCCSFALIADCGLLLGLSSQETFFFSIDRASPFLRHLLLILSCLIRDLGGSSRSSGCKDDKWIARLEKWTEIHPLLEFVFTSMHCSSSRIMDGMGGILKVQHRIPINS